MDYHITSATYNLCCALVGAISKHYVSLNSIQTGIDSTRSEVSSGSALPSVRPSTGCAKP